MAVANYIASQLERRLRDGQTVLWLVAGGSAMNVAIAAAKQLIALPLSNLTVSLTDERYGLPGHSDSNWRQLLEKGFEVPDAQLVPVLNGKSQDETADMYSKNLNRLLNDCDYSIALVGMGPDGHIFGIKPHSPAVTAKSDICAYQWDDYSRITPTINLIKRLDDVVLYAFGREKWPQIKKLDRAIPTDEQPAQLLKKLPRVIIYNDYKGD